MRRVRCTGNAPCISLNAFVQIPVSMAQDYSNRVVSSSKRAQDPLGATGRLLRLHL